MYGVLLNVRHVAKCAGYVLLNVRVLLSLLLIALLFV